MDTERKIYVNNDLDIVTARMQAREMAKKLGFRTADQARISLAASELARVLTWNSNLPGEITMSLTHQNGHQGLRVICLVNMLAGNVSDQNAISQRSLSSACQLVDESIVEEQGATQALVTLIKWLS